MLHRFAIADGGVSYANRFLESKAFRAAEETGKITYAEFATDPCRTLFGRVASIFDPKLTDNCCVNVSAYAREVTAFTETTMSAALRARHAKDAWRVRLWRGLDRTNLDGAPALRCEARLPLQLHRRSRHEERLSPVPHRRRRHAVRACRHSGRAAGLHAQLRHERGSPHPYRVPLGGEPDRPQAVGQALHPELSLGGRARAGLPCRREGHGPAGAHGQGRCKLRLPSCQRLRRCRAALPSMSSSIPTRRLSISSTWRGSAPARRSPPSAR